MSERGGLQLKKGKLYEPKMKLSLYIVLFIIIIFLENLYIVLLLSPEKPYCTKIRSGVVQLNT